METSNGLITLSRRRLLYQAVAAGMSVPAVGVLLAACGSDDDDEEEPTATIAAAQPTATTAGGNATATTVPSEPTATTTVADPTATTAGEEPTATQPPATATTPSQVSEIYGIPIEPAENDGGTLVRGTREPIGGSFILWTSYISIFEAMTESHPDTAEPMPLLAEAWESSADGMTWTFTLRQGVTFQDGEPLTTDDVIFSLQLWSRAGYGGEPVASAEITAPDDSTVELALAQLRVDMPNEMTFYSIFAQHVLSDLDPATATLDQVSEHPANTGEDPSLIVSTGPFRVTEVVMNDYMTLERYDGYWVGRPHLDTYIIRQLDDQGAIAAQLQTGDLDVYAQHNDVMDPAIVIDFEGTDVNVVQFGGTYGLSLNPTQNPEKSILFQDVRVRQALIYALDRQAIVAGVLFGYGEVAHTTLVLPWAYNPDDVPERYPYDPEMAAQLLDEAGWVVGEDGVREKDGQRFSFEGWHQSGDTSIEALTVVLQEYWRAVGIEMRPASADGNALYSRFVEARDFEMVIYPWIGGQVDQTVQFHCESEWNLFSYCNPELDALMEAAQEELDPERRRALNTDIQNLLMEELPKPMICWQYSLGGGCGKKFTTSILARSTSCSTLRHGG